MNSRFIKMILFTGIVIIPLLINPWSIDVFEVDKITVVRVLGAISFGAVLTAGFSIKKWWTHLDLRDPTFWYFLFVLWSIVATIVSISPVRSIFGSLWREGGLITLLASAGIFLLFKTYSLSAHTRRWIAYCIVGVSSLMSILALLQYFFHTQLYVDLPLITTAEPYQLLRPAATFGHPLYFAITLLLCAPFVWYSWVSSGKRVRIILASVAVMQFFALYLTRSRAAFFVLCGMVLIVAMFHFRKHMLGVGVVFIIFGIIAISIPSFRETVFRLASLTSRGNEWRYGTALLIKCPLFGYGAETYDQFSASRIKTAYEPHDGIADRLHNLELDIAWNAGIPALLFFLVMFVIAFRSGLKTYKTTHDPWIAATLFSLSGYILVMQTSFDFSFTYFMFPFLLAQLSSSMVIATASSRGEPICEPSGSREDRHGLQKKIIIISISIFVFLILTPSIAGMVAFHARSFIVDFRYDEEARWYHYARRIYPFWPELYLNERDALASFFRLHPERGDDNTLSQLSTNARRVGLPWYINNDSSIDKKK